MHNSSGMQMAHHFIHNAAAAGEGEVAAWSPLVAGGAAAAMRHAGSSTVLIKDKSPNSPLDSALIST